VSPLLESLKARVFTLLYHMHMLLIGFSIQIQQVSSKVQILGVKALSEHFGGQGKIGNSPKRYYDAKGGWKFLKFNFNDLLLLRKIDRWNYLFTHVVAL